MEDRYDAFLVVSFGGPEGPEEVLPFLENVLRGRNVPRERMLEVAHHYELFGGVSPINSQNRALIEALSKEFRTHGIRLPIYWGNRNWHPLMTNAIREMGEEGVRRALAFVTSAYSSYSGCRQYRENIHDARKEVGPKAPRIDKMRVYFNHPGFIDANVDRLRTALAQIPGERREGAVTLFTAHSIPLAMARNCQYEAQLLQTARLVAEGSGCSRWQLVYQSRSGPPSQPWLAPDVLDGLSEIRDQGAESVVLAPIGFISDHMEVIYDLDHEAAEHCRQIGLEMVRASTAGIHRRFVSGIREMVQERLADGVPAKSVGDLGLYPEQCSAQCCAPALAQR